MRGSPEHGPPEHSAPFEMLGVDRPVQFHSRLSHHSFSQSHCADDRKPLKTPTAPDLDSLQFGRGHPNLMTTDVVQLGELVQVDMLQLGEV
jgi:hypothetical protein